MAFVGVLIKRTIHDGGKMQFIKIGDVRVALKEAKRPELVPAGFADKNPPPQIVQALKWLMQKDALKQDVFLIGTPGFLRSSIVFSYLEFCNREFEYLSVTRDTTEADIKQRREISGGNAFYSDLCAVRAAVEGRVLIIDGVEKAERNVLPILNNLLENREMQLDDGRFLMAHNKYDKLKQKYSEEELKKMKLERVSENFHVIALGIPIPTFKGHTLDPPLRSRFQCKNISELSFESMSKLCCFFAPNLKIDKINSFLAMIYGLNSQNLNDKNISLPVFPVDNLISACRIWNINPDYSEDSILNLCYPKKTILKADSQIPVLDEFFKKFKIKKEEPYLAKMENVSFETSKSNVEINFDGQKLKFEVPAGVSQKTAYRHEYVPTKAYESLLADLMITHAVSDFCLLGPRGSGKTTIVEEFAKRLGYETETIVLYQDMNSRELIQQRRMLPNGDTVWEDSQLVRAAKHGTLCILDGLEKIHWSTAEMLAPLIHHRFLQLPDGTRLIGSFQFDALKIKTGLTDEELSKKGVFKIAESFRLVGLGDSESVNSSKWLNEQVLSMFMFHNLKPLSVTEQCEIVFKLVPNVCRGTVKKLICFTETLNCSPDANIRGIGASLSLRRLIYIFRRHAKNPNEGVFDALNRAALSRFMPAITKSTFENLLNEAGIFPDSKIKEEFDDGWKKRLLETSENQEDSVGSESMIPDIVFFDNKQHLKVMNDMAKDFELGSHLLLIGNQGVGKNKVTDRFLQLIKRPRQYMQLHRDTTVQSLTVQTTIVDGILKHEDSPLVKSVRDGLVLIVDEADKAPLYVVAVLKSLLDSGILYLSDGRRIQPAELPMDFKSIPIHSDFRLIMLANRPGFPFLGNDLFGVLGDLFSVHVVDNPSRLSELAMLRQYGPNVSQEHLNQLVAAFDELREMANNSVLTYPYSTRELVNIVKHLQAYPNDSLTTVVRNVFDFDSFTKETTETIETVFQKYGIPIGIKKPKESIFLSRRFSLAKPSKLGIWGIKSNIKPFELKNTIRSLNFEFEKYFQKRMIVLDLHHSRAQKFSEEQFLWQLPISDVNICSDILNVFEKLFIVTVNPTNLYIIHDEKKSQIQEIELSSFFSKLKCGDFRPRFKLGKWNQNQVLIHEETSNTLLLVDFETCKIKKLMSEGGMPSMLASTLGKLSPINLSNNGNHWRMADSNERPVLFEINGKEIRILHPGDLPAEIQILTLPENFPITNVLPISKDKYLINGTTSNYLLTLESDGRAFLRILDESIDTPVFFETISRQNQKQTIPEFLLTNEQFYGLKSEMFPESFSKGELFGWRRPGPDSESVVDKAMPYRSIIEKNKLVHPQKEVVAFDNGLIVRLLPKWLTPLKALPKNSNLSDISCFLEVLDSIQNTIQFLPIPNGRPALYHGTWLASITKTNCLLAKSNDGKSVYTCQTSGVIRKWEIDETTLMASLQAWNKIFGEESATERIEFERDESQIDMSKLINPKVGKYDPKNDPHVGGNQWMGGSGGYSTAGLGGAGGPFRLDSGNAIHQIHENAKEQIPEEYKLKAREINRQEYYKRLKQIDMNEHEADQYELFNSKIKKQVTHLKSIIDSLEVREHERQWIKHQTSGDLDDGKLIEGMTGEKSIYRRRMDLPPEIGTIQKKPKRLRLCFDVSGSMYRFNGHDQRLQKSLEAALMVMESLEGKSEKIKYDIVGHSGDGPEHKFTDSEKPPKNEKQKFDVLKKMLLHSQFCMSGDYTLEALSSAIDKIGKEIEIDERFVILLSDANLDRYGIHPKHLARLLNSEINVHAFVIFIGSLGPQAEKLIRSLPIGKAFYAEDTTQLPNIIQSIFASTLIK